jgi:NTP pyrophosphatase (non-canonical NTP hydrolase)
MSEMELCPKCGSLAFYNSYFSRMMCNTCEHTWDKIIEKTSISFPILNNLTPTVESCTMKVLEEVGELMQMIGKEQRKSGELAYARRKNDWALLTISEALDVAQASVTMALALCTEYEIDINGATERHEMKLREKGYLK